MRGVLARQKLSWLTPLTAILASLATACGSPARADDATDRKIADAALRESRDMIARDLFGHYDLTDLEVLRVEDLRGRVSAERDYGLVRVRLLAVDGDGAWRAVSPHWRSRRQYSLDGYLLLEGRDKEGYVLPPRP